MSIEKEGNFEQEAESVESSAAHIQQLLKTEEENNPEYKDCLEKLEQEYKRRAGKASIFIKRLKEKIKDFDWFIIPPVMDRTDYGYATDLDLVVIYEQEGEIPEYEHEIDDIFIIPKFIPQDQLAEIKSKYPEIGEWYQAKIEQEKPEEMTGGEKIDTDSFVDKLRYAIPPEKREQIREFRLKLADHFIDRAKKRINIVTWRVSGSTVEAPEQSSECSDLDVDILIDPQTPEAEDEMFFYLQHYLAHKFSEKFGVKIDVHADTVQQLKEMGRHDEKLKEFYERYFDVEL